MLPRPWACITRSSCFMPSTEHQGAAGASVYAASKHAVEEMTKSAALEATGFGVRVNAVAPGPTDTDMLTRFRCRKWRRSSPGLLGHRAGSAFSARGVDGRIESAEAGDGLIHQIADFVVMTNVGLDEGGFGAEAAKFGFECFALRVLAAGDDARARLGQSGGGGATDAGQSAGDQYDCVAHF
jgi:Enoyl-(Acyl carrier protein) reductase